MEVLAEETDKTADPQQINFVSAKVTLRSGDKSYGPFFVSNRFEFFEDFNKHTFVHGERDFAITLQRTRYNYDFKVGSMTFASFVILELRKPKTLPAMLLSLKLMAMRRKSAFT